MISQNKGNFIPRTAFLHIIEKAAIKYICGFWHAFVQGVPKLKRSDESHVQMT